jgi:hypothetical protein
MRTLAAVVAVLTLAAVVTAAPAFAQQSGSTYDWRSGNRYNWTHNEDGSTDVRGFSTNTGSMWRTHIAPNGDQRGTDSRGNMWRYNSGSGFYWNSDGTTCIGKGYARTCN